MPDNPAKAAPKPKQAAAAAKPRQTGFAQAFSQIVALMMRDPKFRGLRIADLEWLVMPPVRTGQWQIAHGVRPKKDGATEAQAKVAIPIAAALWARVSPAVDAKLSANLDKPMVLKPEEWKSGDIIWLIACTGEQRYMQSFLKQMQENTLKGRPVKLRAAGPGGKTVVRTLADLLKQPAAKAKAQQK